MAAPQPAELTSRLSHRKPRRSRAGAEPGCVSSAPPRRAGTCCRPRAIVGFERRSVRTLLTGFRRSAEVILLEVDRRVRPKSPEARRAYRRERFRSYFQEGRPQSVSLRNLGLHGRVPPFRSAALWRNLLCAFCDPWGHGAGSRDHPAAGPGQLHDPLPGPFVCARAGRLDPVRLAAPGCGGAGALGRDRRTAEKAGSYREIHCPTVSTAWLSPKCPVKILK